MSPLSLVYSKLPLPIYADVCTFRYLIAFHRPDLIDNADHPYRQYASVFAAAAAYMSSDRPLPFNCSDGFMPLTTLNI